MSASVTIIRNTFRGQAGYTALLRRRLTAEDRETLSAVPLPSDKSLMDATDAWLDAGDRLGRLEEEKARLEAANPTVAGRIHDARMKWIRVVNVLLTTAELAELDETSERALFGPLRDAEAKAERRLARKARRFKTARCGKQCTTSFAFPKSLERASISAFNTTGNERSPPCSTTSCAPVSST